MRRIMAVTAAFCAICSSSKEVSSEIKKAVWSTGADTKVVFRVVDESGIPVCGVKTVVGFWMPWNESAGIETETDASGIAIAEGRSSGEINCYFTKDAYYEGSYNYHIYDLPNGGVDSGRWMPYGTTNVMVLKSMRRPVEMCVGCPRRLSDLVFPATNQAVGFDFEKWDWCKPYGNGHNDDCQMVYHGEEGWLDLMFTNGMDGATLCSRSLTSSFQSVYNADTNAIYQRSLSFRSKRVGKPLNLTSEYIVFRVRTRVDGRGRLTSANYGKIYGPLSFRRRLSFTSYFNPTPNDTNLECDTRKNLLKDKRGRPLPIAAP